MADTQDLVVDLKIRDNLSVGLANAKTSLGGFDASVTKSQTGLANMALSLKNVVGGFLAFQGVSAALGFLAEAGRAAADDEASVARLTQALKANAPEWANESKAIEDAIAAGARLGFTDDEIRDSLSRLSAATHDLGEAISVQNTAMDLARFKGISLGEATSALTKIEAGRFRALADLGIVLEKGATQTEALAAVQKVAGGQAKAFGDTTAGALATVDVALQELKETIGTELVKGVRTLGSALNDLKPGFDVLIGIAGVLSAPIKEANEQANKVKEIAADLKKNADAAAVSVANQAQAYKELNAALAANHTAFTEGAISEDEARKRADELGAAFKDLLVATDDFSHVQQDTSTHTLAAAAAFDRAHDSSEAYLAGLKLASTIHKTLAQDLIENTTGLGGYTIAVLGAGKGTDTLSDSLLRVANDAKIAALGIDTAASAADRAFEVFRHAPNKTGDIGGLPTNFQTGGDADALANHRRAQTDAQAEADRRTAEALASARTAADAYATTIRDKVAKSFDTAGSRADSLFDKLHARHLQAIADTEKLAEKQHSTALQAISDALKLKLDASAAPVTAAEEAQRRIELQRQRRGLGEGLQSALASGDPTAIRNAQEALQSFNAAQRIEALKLTQSKLDLAAQIEAGAATKAADDKLNAAKLAQAADLDRVNAADKKRQGDFDKALAALKVRDADASPAKSKADISKLEERFGITTDAKGFHHIDDPLVIAIKGIKIPPPVNNFTVTVTSPPIFLNGRLIAAAMASSQSPSATPTVRTGALAPRP